MQPQNRTDVRWEWIGEGWEMYQQQMGNWILISLVGFLISLVPMVPILFLTFASMGLGQHKDPQDIAAALQAGGLSVVTQIVAGVVGWLIQAFTYSGYYNTAMKQLRGEPIALSDFFGGLQYFVPALGVSALVGIVVLIGNFLCCLGFVFQILTVGLFMFAFPLIVHRKLGPIAALQESSNLAMKNIVMFTLFAIVAHIVGLCGAIVCGIGVIFTLPLLFCIITCAYRDCTGLNNSGNDSYTPPPPPTYGGYEPPPPPSSWQ